MANNKTVLQDFQQALELRLRGEPVELRDFLTEDVVWHFPQSTATASSPSEYCGREEVLGLFSGVVAQFYVPESIRFDYHALTAEADRVHLHFSLRATTSNGRDYCNQYQSLFRFHNGRIAEVWEYFDTAYLASAFADEG